MAFELWRLRSEDRGIFCLRKLRDLVLLCWVVNRCEVVSVIFCIKKV